MQKIILFLLAFFIFTLPVNVSVIPAEAGIHHGSEFYVYNKILRQAQDDVLGAQNDNYWRTWIPAFAGMTNIRTAYADNGEEDFLSSSRKKIAEGTDYIGTKTDQGFNYSGAKKDQFFIKYFAQDFYDDIRDKVEREEKVQIEKQLELSTGIAGNIARAIQRGSDGGEEKEAIEAWCNNDNSIFSSADSCEQELKDLLSFDIDLEKLQTEIEVTTKADEIWSNGTLTDSVFDLVVDLNMIDILLFGLEAEIPKSRWSKQAGNAQLGGGEAIGDAPPAFFDTSNSDGSSQADASSVIPAEAGIQSPNIEEEAGLSETPDQIRDDSSSSPARNDGAIAAFQSPIIDTQNLQCRNPSEFAFLSLIQPPQTEGDTSSNQDSSSHQDLPSGNSQSGDSSGDISDSGTGSDSGNTGGTGLPSDTSNLESQPIQFKEFKKKEGCLYGGFYCPPQQGGRGKNVSEENCDPLSGVCKKCSDPESSINYCLTWEYKKGENQLLSSVLVSDSISGYIDAGNKSYSSLLGAGPLTPTQQQNQAGFLTQVSALFNDPGLFVSVEGKIPDMWTHEAKKIDLTHEGMKKYWEKMSEAEKELLNDNPRTNAAFSVAEDSAFIESQRKQFETDLLLRQSKDDARKVYYKNVNQNLLNFKKVFDARFKDKMLNMPFTELEKAAERSCNK